VDPKELLLMVGMKEFELFKLRQENAQLKQTLKATEAELVRLRDSVQTSCAEDHCQRRETSPA
jgi:hypothetical protein